MATERNILIIVQNLPVPFDRRVWQEASSLRRAGFGVVVICPKKTIYTKSFERLDGIDIYRYPLIWEADRGILGYFIEFFYCWCAAGLLAVKAYLRRPFHAIHACNPPDTYFALALLFRLIKVKFVFDHHDLCPEMFVAKGYARGGLLYRGLLLLERLTFRTADAVIAVNQSHREIAMLRGGLKAASVSIVRSGPPRLWAEIRANRPALKRGRKYLIVYLGEMCAQDGVDHLLRAIGHYATLYPKDSLFALVGGGPDQRRMRNLAHQMHLDDWVTFPGRVPDEVLWDYLSTADVCVDPDPFTEWSDVSTMNKMVEYMAFGKPVVAFDLTEHRRTAENAATYVDSNDDAKFGVAIRTLLLDEERRRQMGRPGQDRFRTLLAWEQSEKALVGLYRRLLAAEENPTAGPLEDALALTKPNTPIADTAETASISAETRLRSSEDSVYPQEPRYNGA